MGVKVFLEDRKLVSDQEKEKRKIISQLLSGKWRRARFLRVGKLVFADFRKTGKRVQLFLEVIAVDRSHSSIHLHWFYQHIRHSEYI